MDLKMETRTQKLKKKVIKIEEMTKDQIRQAILKKRECNSKAQKIVESLLERGITEQYLIKCLPDINQTHFDDIIEERSIAHLCGYPICHKTLSISNIPKQKYRISLKTNKVYDITARKNFCSNICYSAAMYIKDQLLTSPLWFREYEVIPSFHVLKLDRIGSMGVEVDVGPIDRVTLSKKNSFTSINDFAKASLNEISDDVNDIVHSEQKIDTKVDRGDMESSTQLSTRNKQPEEINSVIDDIKMKCNITNTTVSNIVNTMETTSDENNTSSVPKKSNTDIEKSNIKTSTPNPLNIVGEIVEKPESKIDPILITPVSNKIKNENIPKKLTQKKQPLVTALTIEVEKCLAEWFTLDTMLILFGKEKVRGMVADKEDCIKEYLHNFTQGIFYNSNIYDQYQVLCRKLNMLELEDRKFEAETLKRETKPLPEYRMLQGESKKIQLKVKAFFAGEMEVSTPDNLDEPKPIDDENLTNLPLVDKISQNALRRRIVCQHLNKVLPDLLQSLGLLSLTISTDVHLLVNTFKLKANNIMFKPIQWTLIAIIVIKLLSLKDKRLEYLLQQPIAFQHMQLLLLSYNQEGGYLDRLIYWLTDIDRLLGTNDTQLTVQ